MNPVLEIRKLRGTDSHLVKDITKWLIQDWSEIKYMVITQHFIHVTG